MKEINIPFAGFYESKWSDGIDRAEDLEAEGIAEEQEIEKDLVAQVLFDCMSYGKAHQYVARKYVEYYEDHLAELVGFKVKLHYTAMESPKEYNFETDRLFVNVSEENIRKMFKVVNKDRLTEVAKERHTSYSGFHSFYDPDWRSWGPVSTWDHNQLGTLVQALETEQDWEWDVCNKMDEGGVFLNALYEGLDYPKFQGKLAERVLVEAGEIEEDGREFPFGESDPAKYVEKFDELNHLRKS